MYCSNCGKEVDIEAIYCVYCGCTIEQMFARVTEKEEDYDSRVEERKTEICTALEYDLADNVWQYEKTTEDEKRISDVQDTVKNVLQMISLIEEKKTGIDLISEKFEKSLEKESAEEADYRKRSDRWLTVVAGVTVICGGLGFMLLFDGITSGFFFFIGIVVIAWVGLAIFNKFIESSIKKIRNAVKHDVVMWASQLADIENELNVLWNTDEMIYCSNEMPEEFRSKEGMGFLAHILMTKGDLLTTEELFEYARQHYTPNQNVISREEQMKTVVKLSYYMMDWVKRMC